MNGKLQIALILLVAAVIPVSIAVDLLVWPGNDREPGPGCGTIWLGVLPVGGYCRDGTMAVFTLAASAIVP